MKRFLTYRILIPFVTIFFLSDASSATEEGADPDVASYTITVKLDPAEKKLYGGESITFLNTSAVPIDTVCLHLYPNAFRNDSTTFMRESPKWFRKEIAGRKKWGWMEIDSLAVEGPGLRTNRIIIDETILRVPLPAPLSPTESIRLSIAFTVVLPEVIARMGYRGDHYSVGQWFPKMCVLGPDGSWSDHQFHFNAEFFGDFGTYDVSITLPEKYVVGATGYLRNEQVNGDDTKTIRYLAEHVHDFYWEADPDFIETLETFEDIQVIFLCLPENKRKISRVMNIAREALTYYGRWYGPYPYGKLVITDSEIGPGGGGMEYPMIVATELAGFLPESVKLLEGIVIHEIGHQWWYGVVASNQMEEAWLDEGINTYSTRKVLEAVYGEKANWVSMFGVHLSEKQYERISYLADPDTDPVVRKAWEYKDFFSYTTAVYSKASLMLETLERYVGEDVMTDILRTYYRRFSFRHPTTADFIAVAGEVSGRDLDWFFDPWLYGTGTYDYAVTEIESERIEFAADTTGILTEMYRTKVTVERLGEVAMPVDVLIELKNGETLHREWDGKERWIRYEFETGSPVRSAVVDPEGKIALDVNMNNNGMTTSSQDLVLFRVGSHLLFTWETLIQWLTAW